VGILVIFKMTATWVQWSVNGTERPIRTRVRFYNPIAKHCTSSTAEELLLGRPKKVKDSVVC
jgi:hypothetical protein